MQISDRLAHRSHRRKSWGLAFRFLPLCALSAVLFAGTNNAADRTQPVLGHLPATFTGMLPCADCPGIEYHLDLFPAGYYFMRMTYLGRNTHFDEIGRWSTSVGGRKLILHGAAASKTQFAIGQAKTLRVLDGNGNEIPTKLDYDLHRAATFSPIEPRLKLEGSYQYSGGSGTFTDCLTANNWRVVSDKNGIDLQKAYLAARTTAGAARFVTIGAKLGAKPKAGSDAAAIDKTLTVVGPFQLNPGGSCPSK